MTNAMPRTRRHALIVATLLPVLFSAVFVRPVRADAPHYGLYTIDLAGYALGVDGEIGAGGGLTPVDPAVATALARLDSSPSATVSAAAVEPGTLPRTVVAVGNSSAGQELASVPLAQANHPGEGTGNADLLGQTDIGGVITSGLIARAEADRLTVWGESSVGQLRLPDAPASAASLWTGLDQLRLEYPTTFAPAEARAASMGIIDNATTTVSATVDESSGRIVTDTTSSAERIQLFGEIDLRGIVGTTAIEVTPDGATTTATLDIASVTIAGVPVEVSDAGVVVDGTGIDGDDARAVTDAINEVLAEAGISIALAAPVSDDADGRATADSRGLRIEMRTPALADGGIPANDAALVIGGVRSSVLRQASTSTTPTPVASPTPTPTPTPSTAPERAEVAGPRSGGGVGSGTTPPTSVVATPTAPSPQVAPPATAGTPTPTQPVTAVAVVGVELDPRVAIALLGLWQALSLGGVTGVLIRAKRNGSLT